MKEGMIYQLFAKACRESGCAIKPSNDLDVIYKFTELLINEAARVAEQWTPDTEECGHTALVADKIKQHFGVKE